MESPQKKAAFGTAFGSNSMTFGQPTSESTNSFGGFGGSQSATTSGSNLFSKSVAASAPMESSVQPALSQSFGGFGQLASAPQSQPSGFGGFGQTSSFQAPSTNAPFAGFGQAASAAGQSPLPAFGAQQTTEPQAQKPKFAFGQTNTASQPQGTTFSGSTAPANESSVKPLFGSTPSQTTSSGFAFGQPAKQTDSISSPFQTFGKKPEEPKPVDPSVVESVSALPRAAGQALAAPEISRTLVSDAPPANPFAGVFGGGSSTSQPKPAPLFNFGTPSQPPPASAGNQEPAVAKPTFTFGTPSQPASEPIEDEPQPKTAKSPFSFGATSQPAPSFSSGGLFSPAKAAAENVAPTGGLFSKLNSAVEASPKSPPLFGASAKQSMGSFNPGTSNAPANATTSLNETPKSAAPPVFATPSYKAREQPQPVEQPHFTSRDFGAATSAATQLSASKESLSAVPPGAQTAKVTNEPTNSALALESVKRPVFTKGPSRAPGHLSGQQFKEYDRNYRLHSLNHGLQRKLATLDPRSQDFDNVIRHYVAARENIGTSLGLYNRTVAGTKRKSEDVDYREDEADSNKRSREDPAQKPSGPENISSSGLTSATSANAERTSSQSTGAVGDAASNPFSSSTGGPSPPTTGFKPATSAFGSSTFGAPNPFANLSQQKNAASPANSTTPTKSPPKKPTFGMPQVASGGNTNFLAAFGQQAKVNAAKFEKNLMEKRKAEDFDSDEDDEEAYNKKVEEENRAKRAKIEAVAKGGFTPSFGSTTKANEVPPASTLFEKPTAPKPNENQPSPATFGSITPSNPFSASSSSKEAVSKPTFTGFGSAAFSDPVKSLMASMMEPAPVPAPVHIHDSEDDVAYVDIKEDDEDEVSGSSNGQADEADDEENADAYDEEAEDSLPEDEVVPANGDEDEDEDDDDNDLQAAMDRARRNPNAGKSLFDRIEPNPNKDKPKPATNGNKTAPEADSGPILQSAKNSSFPPAVWGSHIGQSTPDQPAFSPLTPVTGVSSMKPASTFTFTPSAPSTTPTPAPGASIFSGGFTRTGPVPGEGLFGSRPSTPSNAEANGNLARSVLTSPAGTDNTWKQGSTISFGNGDEPTSAPTFKFTAASPSDKDKSAISNSLSTLFGTSAASSGTTTPNLGFKFGGPAPAPGYLGAVSHFGGESVASSVASSRATSPGLTDNESVATNETEETTDDPQTSLMDARTGEENETTLWEGRSKALMFVNEEMAKGTKYNVNDWNSVGVGMIRVLKDKGTNRTRVVFRVEPSANILFNSHLISSTTYDSVPGNKSGAVRGTLMHNGNLTRLVFKLKTTEMANELAKILEENKSAQL